MVELCAGIGDKLACVASVDGEGRRFNDNCSSSVVRNARVG